MNPFESKSNCTRLLFFLIFIIVIKIFGAKKCHLADHYTINNNSGDPCFRCQNCPHGYGLLPLCGTVLLDKKDIEGCKPCISGTYKDKYGPESCKPCTPCSPHEIAKSNCTTEADTICSSKCEKGYYYQRNTYDCHPCSLCCNDTKDVVKSECIAHGMPVTHRCSPVDRALDCPLKTTLAKSTHAAPSNNTSTSGPPPPKTTTTTTETTPAPTTVETPTTAKTTTTPPTTPPPTTPITTTTTTTTVTTRTSTGTKTTTTFSPVRKGRLERLPWMIGGSVIAVIFIIICIICKCCELRRRYAGCEMPDNSPDIELSIRNPVVKNRSSNFSNPVASVCTTCTSLRNELGLLIASRKDCREGEKCIISCQMWKKTMVIFDEKHFAFTWCKDGVKLDGHDHHKELTLEKLKVSDFGTYELSAECSKHVGGLTDSPKIKSEALFLNVLPGPDSWYKKLTDLPQTVIEDIAHRLSTWNPSIGNWKKVAEHYEMSNDDIKHKLEPRNIKDGDYGSAKYTLEYITSSFPTETVYDFCKFLKTIKQNEIVKILEDYLVCEDKEITVSCSSQSPRGKIDSRETSKDEQEPKSSILGSNKVMPSREGFLGQKNGAYKDEGCIPGQATERNTELSVDNAGANDDK